MAVNGAAMIVGGGLTMGLAKQIAPQKLLVFGMSVSAVGFLILGWSTMLWLTLVAEFICGIVMPCIQIGINTLILKNTEADFVGRVNGILGPLFIGAMVITMSVAGKLKEWFSLLTIFEVSVALFVIGIVVMLPVLKHQPGAVGGEAAGSSGQSAGEGA
jgi:MFS family permease